MNINIDDPLIRQIAEIKEREEDLTTFIAVASAFINGGEPVNMLAMKNSSEFLHVWRFLYWMDRNHPEVMNEYRQRGQSPHTEPTQRRQEPTDRPPTT